MCRHLKIPESHTLTYFKPAAFAFAFLAACAPTAAIISEPDPALNAEARAELLSGECAIYYAATAQLEAQGRAAGGNTTRGCPTEAAAIPADINPMVSVPPVIPGYPETLYQRMIARGIPRDMADDIAKSKAFWDLVAKRDSLVAHFASLSS